LFPGEHIEDARPADGGFHEYLSRIRCRYLTNNLRILTVRARVDRCQNRFFIRCAATQAMSLPSLAMYSGSKPSSSQAPLVSIHYFFEPLIPGINAFFGFGGYFAVYHFFTVSKVCARVYEGRI